MLTPDEIITYAKADRKMCRVVSAAGITIDPEPSAPPSRPGYSWIPKQISAGGAIMWVESGYDSTMPGTKETPIPYTSGLTAYPNYYYVLDGVRKVWTGEVTVSPAWDDERFAEL